MKRISTLLFIFLFSFAAQSQTTYLKAVLDGGQEVPANASTATGIAIVKYNTTTRVLELMGDYQNLTATITGSHIHSPAPVGSNAGVLVSVTNTGGTTGTLTGLITLTLAQETDLLAGNMYVNTHNASFPGGEIRGQLTTTTSGQTDFLTGRLQGAQEVPPNGSLATGSVMALLDKTTGMVYLTGSFTGLTAAATASHIHKANPTLNGGVIIPLTVSADTKGTVHIASAIGATDLVSMTGGGTYVNIHNASFPGGELRGQLIMESQMVYLKAVLQGSQEVPANASTARGTVIVRYNTITKALEVGGNYQNLSVAITASHVHSPAAVGANAGVLLSLANNGGTSGTLIGTMVLTAPQEADLLAGLMYVNVHNANFPGGEIRGQLTTTTSADQSYYFTGLLASSQEVPSNASIAAGNVAVLLDKITNEVFVVGNFSGLTSAATASHIHGGSAGMNGGVAVGLFATADVAGTITGTATVRSTFADSMVLGYSYVNVHNTSFPGGEIRAQLGNLVLPVKLTYFNGYKQANKVALLWESSEEINLKQYTIEQQGQEPGRWITKAVVAAKANNGASKYSMMDEPVLSGAKYAIYRLKMTDIDGKISYSPVIKINFSKSAVALSILSNPITNNQLKYLITGLPGNNKAVVSIIDFSGRVVAKATAQTLTNNAINVANLPSGIYKLVVRIDDNMLQQSFSK